MKVKASCLLAVVLFSTACAPGPARAPRRPGAATPAASAPKKHPYPSPGLLPTSRKIAPVPPELKELIAVATDPAGGPGAPGDEAGIVFLEAATGKETGSIATMLNTSLSPISWSPDGHRLLYAAGTCEGPCTEVLRVADIAAGTDKQVATGLRRPFTAVWLDPAHFVTGVGASVALFQAATLQSRSLFGSHHRSMGLERDRAGAVAVALAADFEGTAAPPPEERHALVKLSNPLPEELKRDVFAPDVPGDLLAKHPSQEFVSPAGLDHCMNPVFSPDNTRIGVTCRPDPDKGSTTAWTIDVARGVWSELMTSESIARVGHIEKFWWTADGRQILVQWSSECEVPLLYLANADGSSPRRLFQDLSGARFGSLSPDGSRMAFTASGCGGAEQVFTSAPHGADLRKLADGSHPVWSPVR